MSLPLKTMSPKPTRFPGGGISTDPSYYPLADFGLPNPLSYQVICDDFNGAINTFLWTKYLKSTGTVAPVAGDGGRLLFTTAAVANDVVALQPSVGLMTLNAGKKNFFLTRLQVSSIAANGPTIIAGLIDVTATPNLTITDGIYFSINAGLATLYLVDAATSTSTQVAIPTAAYATQANPSAVAMTTATDYDFAFYVDRMQNVFAFVNQYLVGYIPPSGTGVFYPGTTNVLLPNEGPVAAYRQGTPPLVLTGVNLAPSLILSEGAGAAAVTMNVDFVLAANER